MGGFLPKAGVTGLRGCGRRIASAALVLLAASPALADGGPGRWRLSDDGAGMSIATLAATSKLITGGGALSYSPTLTIGCRPDGEPHWLEWLQLNDPVSAGTTLIMAVTVDDGPETNESWSVGYRGKVLVRESDHGVARLVPAHRLHLSWRFGLLAGYGTADFDLDGVSQAVGKLAQSCRIDAP